MSHQSNISSPTEMYMQALTPSIGSVYKIISIHPLCSWYLERDLFENKLMKCVEIFEEDSAGFLFLNKDDCPDTYDPGQAFCFYCPDLENGSEKDHTAGKTAE